MNRLQKCCSSEKRLLSLFFSAGYPTRDGLPELVCAAADAGVDFIEVGFPFSDSLVDGPRIQQCNEVAIQNGMTLDVYLEQVASIRSQCDIPLVFMGTCNTLVRRGERQFVEEASQAGIDAMILPDLPPEEYVRSYQSYFEAASCGYIPLVTQWTDNERVQFLDSLAGGFLYCVSMTGTTGGGFENNEDLQARMASLQKLNLKNKLLLGFGIQQREHFEQVCKIADGGIIGTAMLNALADATKPAPEVVREFVISIRTQE